MLPGWEVLNNYSKHWVGRIWVCWDPNASSVKAFAIHEQVSTCKVASNGSGDSWMFSVVYGVI